MTTETTTEVSNTEAEVRKYHIHVTSIDSLGFNMIQNIIEMANLGAVLKPGTLPIMRFPHSCSMYLESAAPPTPRAGIRVFEYDTNKEVFAAFVEPKAATFDMNTDEEKVVDLSTNQGTPWTREQLLGMDFNTELRAVCDSVGITGRSKDKMIKEYLAKYE